MRLVGWHDDHLALLHSMCQAAYGYLSFAVQEINQCVIRRGVFAKTLRLVEGEEGD